MRRSGRDVAHALADGGVTALEVTMTVPRRDRSHRRAGGDAAAGVHRRRRHGPRSARRPRDVIAPAPSSSSARCCSPTSSRRAATRDVAVMPGCFTPTEILTAWDAGADIVKVFPATSLGPAFFKDMRGPLPQLQADADRRRHARRTPATGFVPARSRSASAPRSSTLGRGERRFDVTRRAARHFVARGRRAPGRRGGSAR